MMRFSLLPDFNRWRKARSTGDMSVMPSILIFTNCYAVEFYAYAIGDYVPLFGTSMLGVIMGAIFSCFFYRWTDNKRGVMKVFAFSIFVCCAIAIYSILALSGRTGQSRHSVGTTLGFITIATTIGMYASPMATIVRVIRTKTATSMPLTMGIVNVLNSICWTIYAALVNNMFIMAPNIAGIVLGTMQMIVTYIYRPVNEDTSVENQISVTTVNVSDHHQNLRVDLRKSSNYNELRSPCTT
ncbi:Bidirectional sugar transporter SWEET15 [Phytophthora citrophthora]|uniref:Sugar transporter SWEET1 n=1 Tax=Phytophthora citrophthora TaxID=4793 RepID=A0AAD9GPN1_9STRA|nr:Bidirectional sugar transporter SWEET15 [Phytophthora citrophthora]